MSGAPPGRRPPERWRALYGTPDGVWAIIEAVVGVVAPPALRLSTGHPGRLVEAIHLGDPNDAIRKLYNAMWPGYGPDRARELRQWIAAQLGVSEDMVARYLGGRSEPKLTAGAWSLLVIFLFREHAGTGPAARVAGQ